MYCWKIIFELSKNYYPGKISQKIPHICENTAKVSDKISWGPDKSQNGDVLT